MKVLNFLLRMVFGAIGIQLINALLLSQNISVFVGLNVLTLLTVGSLGIRGLGLLYGLAPFAILRDLYNRQIWKRQLYFTYDRSRNFLIWLMPVSAQPVSAV